MAEYEGHVRATMEPVRIPFLDLGRQHEALGGQLADAMAAVLADGRFVGGPAVEAFEAEWAAYCGVTQAVGVANGTDALEVALVALGIGPGDEVVVPAHTFVASAEAVRNVGAEVVFADIDPLTFNLDPAAAEACISPRTACILAVHLYGQPADMHRLRELADRHGLALVEDAAQAHGASWEGRPVGSQSDVACFSFYPSKNLGALGDAGAIVTSGAALASRARAIRDHGQAVRDRHEVGGRNSRLDALQAAVLRVKLPFLDEWNAARRELAVQYTAGLDGLPGIRTPWVAPGAQPVFHVYALRVAQPERSSDVYVGEVTDLGGMETVASRRDGLAEGLARRGVGTRVYYPLPVHHQPAFIGARVPCGAPEAERAAREMLALPLYPELTRAEVDRVVEAVAAWCEDEVRG